MGIVRAHLIPKARREPWKSLNQVRDEIKVYILEKSLKPNELKGLEREIILERSYYYNWGILWLNELGNRENWSELEDIRAVDQCDFVLNGCGREMSQG